MYKRQGLISDEVNAQYRVYNDNTPYEFIDSKVEAIVRATLKKDTGVIYYRDLSKITRFSNDVSGINSNSAIKSLDDLLSLVNLSEIYLKNETSVSDFSVLNSVKGLTSLTLNNCGLSSESAKSIYALSSLSSLDLSGNGISDISQISAMTGLRNLNLSENLITDISPLANLINLKSLNLSNNKIYDLNPLSNVTALSELDISDNVTVTNLSGISRLTNIQTLKMSNVTITNLDDLRTFTGLVNLKIDGTLITNLEPLNGITSLSALDVSRTNITDFSVLATTNIKNLVADNMGLTVISSLSEISTLEVLEVIGNTISDVSALAGLPRLKTINLSKNAVANLETLSECKSLTLINCTGMDIPGDTLRLFESLGVTVIAA